MEMCNFAAENEVIQINAGKRPAERCQHYESKGISTQTVLNS